MQSRTKLHEGLKKLLIQINKRIIVVKKKELVKRMEEWENFVIFQVEGCESDIKEY